MNHMMCAHLRVCVCAHMYVDVYLCECVSACIDINSTWYEEVTLRSIQLLQLSQKLFDRESVSVGLEQ